MTRFLVRAPASPIPFSFTLKAAAKWRKMLVQMLKITPNLTWAKPWIIAQPGFLPGFSCADLQSCNRRSASTNPVSQPQTRLTGRHAMARSQRRWQSFGIFGYP